MDTAARPPSQGRARGASLGLPSDGPGALASFGTRVLAYLVDAVIAALVGRAAALGLTAGPPPGAEACAAATEGWIHVPNGALAALRRA